jgi:hypothetical protein
MDRVVGVEELEKRALGGRPYRLAHPELANLPSVVPVVRKASTKTQYGGSPPYAVILSEAKNLNARQREMLRLRLSMTGTAPIRHAELPHGA